MSLRNAFLLSLCGHSLAAALLIPGLGSAPAELPQLASRPFGGAQVTWVTIASTIAEGSESQDAAQRDDRETDSTHEELSVKTAPPKQESISEKVVKPQSKKPRITSLNLKQSDKVPSENNTRTSHQGAGESTSHVEGAQVGSASLATVEAAPLYLRNPPPEYPESARRMRREGVVKLLVTVTELGRASSVVVTKSSGVVSLDESALRAVHTWTFKPGFVNGLPVISQVEVPVRFQLTQR